MFEELIVVERQHGQIPQQIYKAIERAVREGRLGAEVALPSSRQLAAELGVSRNSVNAAYDLLRAEGIVDVRQGARPKIAQQTELAGAGAAKEGKAPILSDRGQRLALDLRGESARRSGQLEPGAPDEALFPNEIWARLLRRVARRSYGAEAMYGNGEGLTRLRVALAGHLQKHRGVVATPEQVLILPSIQAGLTLIAQCFSDSGDVAFVESPGYFGARTAFANAGLDVKALEVDEAGADIAAYRGQCPRLIYVTPSHQYPTGARMTLQRRLDLLAWAREARVLVIEDDYDSEFLWHGRAIAALQGISGGNEVIYLGTTAKSLLPGLRLAYMVAPAGVLLELAQAQRNLGMRVNIHAQAALAEMIEGGALAAHLNKIAKHYQARGQLLVETLSGRFGDLMDITMPMGGLQTVAQFTSDVDDAHVSAALADAGFDTPALSSYCVGRKRSGLIIGFADATPKRLARFSDALQRALRLT